MNDAAFQVVPMHVARNPVARAIAMAKMRDAQQALLQCASRKGHWRPADAPAVDIGLQRAVEAYKHLPASVTARAWQRMRQIEAEAGLTLERAA